MTFCCDRLPDGRSSRTGPRRFMAFMVVIGQALLRCRWWSPCSSCLRRFAPMDHALTKRHLHDLGKLTARARDALGLHEFLAVADHLVRQSAAKKSSGTSGAGMAAGHGWAGAAAVGHFALPFLLLLSQTAEEESEDLCGDRDFHDLRSACVDVFSLVEPNFAKRTRSGSSLSPGSTLRRRSGSADCGWRCSSAICPAAAAAAGSSGSSKGFESWQKSLSKSARRTTHEPAANPRFRTSGKTSMSFRSRRSASVC